jgi:RND family efflux transporter MFP subunit
MISHLINEYRDKNKMTASTFSQNTLFFTKNHRAIKILLSCTLIVLALSACSEKATDNNITTHTQSAHFLKIQPKQHYIIDRRYLGQVKSKQNTALSFEYPGTVNAVYVDMGDSVKKGQKLASQHTEVLSFKTEELQARVNQFNAQIKLNLANLSRIKSLTNDGYSSKQRLDELNAENEVLMANVSGLKAQIRAINYQINKAILTAPFSGVITKKMVSTGEQSSPAKIAFQLIQQSNNEITFGIPAILANSVKKNQLLTVEVNDDDHQGRILSISKQIDPLNRTVQLRMKLTTPVNSYNGQLVKVHINKKVEQQGYWVPLTAVTDGVRGQWQVFLAIKDKPNSVVDVTAKDLFTIQSATVQVLHANKTSIYISGLPEGEHLIISEGLHRFVSGQRVTSLADIDKATGTAL